MITRIEDASMLAIRDVLSQVSEELTFVQANLFEANISLDELSKDQAPFAVYITPDKIKNKVTKSNLHVQVIPVHILFLTVLDKPDIDFSTSDVDPDINAMNKLASEFVKRLNKSDYTWKEGYVLDFNIDKVYGKFDMHLFGVALSFEWNFNTQHGIGCNV